MMIAGSGSIPGGIYNDRLDISGSGKVTGDIVCTEFHSSGSSSVEGSLECGRFACSGASRIHGNLTAGHISASGSCRIDGIMNSNEEVHLSGSVNCAGIQANLLKVSGSCNVSGDIAAETITTSGIIHCQGLMNAENVSITFTNTGSAESIGGSNIQIIRSDSQIKSGGIFHFLAKTFNNPDGFFDVKDSIEGDMILLENVSAKSVTGRVVTIGPGCDIDHVSYIESVSISPEAGVGAVDQIMM
ncbi:MAG: hypothetical protein MJ064_05760 [Lachnospiraceae bacterium]|nr:hypothetical protein [Lachnospiraceae bacterium]